MALLEGKELSTKIGEYGSASVDVTPAGKVRIELGVEVDLLAELKKLAAKTQTSLDDNAIAWVEGLVKANAQAGA